MTRRLGRIERTAEKYGGLVNPGKGHFNGVTRIHPESLREPLRWRKPRKVFVNSMSDLFHPDIPLSYIQEVFSVMAEADLHVFQVLTKRPERAAEVAPDLPWPPNVVFGTSVEDARVIDRVASLRKVPATIRFISAEPLIGPVGNLDLDGVHWVIVGGESGPKARPMAIEWARDIRDQCNRAGVAFFFKQWGRFDVGGRAVGKKASGRQLDGREWNEYPGVAGFRDPEAVSLAVPRPLTDDEWSQIAPVLPGRQGTAGGTSIDNRRFIEAVRWKAWTCRPWRDLPAEYGNWNTAAVRVKRWSEGEHWPRVCERLDDRYVERFVGIR